MAQAIPSEKIERLQRWLAKLKARGASGVAPSRDYARLAHVQGRLITALACANQAHSRELLQRKERMAITVHDLKVPVTVSLLNLELADMEDDAREKTNYHIAVRRELEFLLDTISSLLALEQGDALRLSFKAVPLRPVLEEVTAKMAVIVVDKPQLVLENHIPARLPLIRADRHMLTRIFNNLFSNAIKYTQAGRVSAQADHDALADMVTVSVRDTGVGIAAERLPHLFQMFEGDAQREDSSGLGLAFVREAMRLHEGKASISSVKGEGTTVSVVFPVFKGE